jgi:hypothetical protein
MATYRSKIHVQYRSGSIAKGVRVVLGFHGLTGGMTKKTFTDNNGMAIVEHVSRGKATIYAQGKDCGAFQAPGETVVFI